MTLYRIANWSKNYETHETRKLVRLSWIPITNKHDGLGFRMIAAEKDSAALFGIWNLLIQVASKSDRDTRGVLVRDGIPLSAASLAVMTGFPEKAFSRALSFFSQASVGWIVAEEQQTNLPLSPGNLPESPGNLPLSPGIHPDEGKGREWKEGNGKKDVGRSAGAEPTSISLESLKADPAYAGIDVEREHSRALVWCKAHSKILTTRRFINWLNRCDKPLASSGTKPAVKAGPTEPNGWKAWLNHNLPDSIYSAGQKDEAHEWSDLPTDVQWHIVKQMQKGQS